jgi:hypothetical protein
VLLYFTTADLPVICPLGSFGAEVHFRIWGAGRGGWCQDGPDRHLQVDVYFVVRCLMRRAAEAHRNADLFFLQGACEG